MMDEMMTVKIVNCRPAALPLVKLLLIHQNFALMEFHFMNFNSYPFSSLGLCSQLCMDESCFSFHFDPTSNVCELGELTATTLASGPPGSGTTVHYIGPNPLSETPKHFDLSKWSSKFLHIIFPEKRILQIGKLNQLTDFSVEFKSSAGH